jgi:uncharacterized membrane protein YhaH (DUF805 family)
MTGKLVSCACAWLAWWWISVCVMLVCVRRCVWFQQVEHGTNYGAKHRIRRWIEILVGIFSLLLIIVVTATRTARHAHARTRTHRGAARPVFFVFSFDSLAKSVSDHKHVRALRVWKKRSLRRITLITGACRRLFITVRIWHGELELMFLIA